MVGDDVAFAGNDRAAAAGLVFDLAALLVVRPHHLDAHERGSDARHGPLDQRADRVAIRLRRCDTARAAESHRHDE
jgi:hypothetical protein